MKNLLGKKYLILALLLAMMAPLSVSAAGKLPPQAGDKEIQIHINGKLQDIPEDMGNAYLDTETERVMVPLRYIVEELHAIVQFAPKTETQEAEVVVGDLQKFVRMKIGSNVAEIRDDGAEEARNVTIDAPAILYDERTYVPIRFVSEVMGLQVEWKDEGLGKVIITGELTKKETKEEAKIDELLNR